MKPLSYLNPQLPMPSPKGPVCWYDSVFACTRCHGCSQHCPSYRLQPEELFSPRGREQILRLLLEGKLKANAHATRLEDTLRACVFCARCTAACAGQIPVPHHLVALRRNRQLKLLPLGVRAGLWTRRQFPYVFDLGLQLGLLLRRFYLTDIFRPFLPDWARHLYRIFPRRTMSLRAWLKRNCLPAQPPKPDLIYLPSFSAQYLQANWAQGVLQLAGARQPAVWLDTSSGLEEYLYGSEISCLKTAKKLVVRWEKTAADRPLPLLTDSVEIYTFLKNYPFLFTALPGWQKRAQTLAENVRFITDFSFPQPSTPTDTDKTALDISTVLNPVPLSLAQRARQTLQAQLGKNLVECEYSPFPLPVAAVSLIKGSAARRMARRQAQDISQQQIKQVYCLSGWAVLELRAALRACKTDAQAKHFIELLSDYGTTKK